MNNPDSEFAAFRAEQKAFAQLGFHVWTGSEFCHYTDLGGLKGILESAQLWLSDHRFLNDVAEYEHGRDIAVQAVQAALAREDDAAFSDVLKDVLSKLQGPAPRGYFIASMSKAKDRLDLWKGYGSGEESVCLVFENDFQLGRQAALTHLPSIEPIEVIYEPKLKLSRLQAVLSIFKDEHARADPTENHRTGFLWKQSLCAVIEREFILYKDDQYASESEVRLVLSSRLVEDKRIRHRVSQHRIVPYVGTAHFSPDAALRLPLREVIVGSKAIHDAIVPSIEVFLAHLGYESVPVRRSTVQFRG